MLKEQKTKINDLLDNSFTKKIDSLKGDPKMKDIRAFAQSYCERLFNALAYVVSDAKKVVNDNNDIQEGKEFDDIYRDADHYYQKCQYRF